MTKIIGLTGGIGSGKTTVANYIASKGIPVYIADDEARNILQLDFIKKKITAVFGNEILIENQLDRKKIAEIVFKNPDKLELLNKIVHPEVQKHFNQWIALHSNAPFVIKEAAILFESGSFKDCNKIITVFAPEKERINRVKKRDLISEEAIKSRIQNQWTDEMRIEKSDFVIKNSNLEETYKKVDKILKLLNNPQYLS